MIKLIHFLLIVFILIINLNTAAANQENTDLLWNPCEQSSVSPESYKPNLLAKVGDSADLEGTISQESSSSETEPAAYEPPDFFADTAGDTVPAYSNAMPFLHRPELHRKD